MSRSRSRDQRRPITFHSTSATIAGSSHSTRCPAPGTGRVAVTFVKPCRVPLEVARRVQPVRLAPDQRDGTPHEVEARRQSELRDRPDERSGRRSGRVADDAIVGQTGRVAAFDVVEERCRARRIGGEQLALARQRGAERIGDRVVVDPQTEWRHEHEVAERLGRTAASSRASIAPVDEATSGAPANPARSTSSERATTQSWIPRRSSHGSDPVQPGRLGATTRHRSATTSRNGWCGGHPIGPCR